MDSILGTVKKMCGVETDYDAFDTDIITDINSVLMSLYQLGVGAKNFVVFDETQTWDQLLGTDVNLAAAQTYVQIKVRLMFDPPQSAVIFDAMNRIAEEQAWRLSIQPEIDLPVPVIEPIGGIDDD